jgi:hypothetical protein
MGNNKQQPTHAEEVAKMSSQCWHGMIWKGETERREGDERQGGIESRERRDGGPEAG